MDTWAASVSWLLRTWMYKYLFEILLWILLGIFSKVEFLDHMVVLGFPGGPTGKQPARQSRRHKRHKFDPWARKIPWRRAWQQTIPVFLPEESHGQRTLADYSYRVPKSWIPLKWLSMHGSSILSFWEVPYCFPWWLYHFTFQPTVPKISNFFTSFPTLVIFVFFFFNIVAILMDVRWYLTVVLISISLTVSDAENLFICWLAICISSFQKLLFKSFVYF